MKRILSSVLLLILLFTAAFAENAGEEKHADMTFADVQDEEVLVVGPAMSKAYIESYLRENPDIIWEIPKFLGVLDLVQHFTEHYPEAENYNTYEALTGAVKNQDKGFCVTFHQNLTAETPFDGYTDIEYAALCAIALRELDADTVNIGYFGNPEVSFTCLDKEKALRFAVQHNQNSIYCITTDETPVNPRWDGSANPIKGVE